MPVLRAPCTGSVGLQHERRRGHYGTRMPSVPEVLPSHDAPQCVVHRSGSEAVYVVLPPGTAQTLPSDPFCHRRVVPVAGQNLVRTSQVTQGSDHLGATPPTVLPAPTRLSIPLLEVPRIQLSGPVVRDANAELTQGLHFGPATTLTSIHWTPFLSVGPSSGLTLDGVHVRPHGLSFFSLSRAWK